MKDKINFWDEICGTLPFRRLGLKKIKSFRRFAYDSNLKGNAAPKTVFTSKKELKIFTSKFESVKFCRENYWFPFLRKKGFFLNNCLIQTFGNDWYIILKK